MCYAKSQENHFNNISAVNDSAILQSCIQMTRTKKTGNTSATITHQPRKSHFVLITTKPGTSCAGSLASSKENGVLFFETVCLTRFIQEQNLLIIFYGRGSSICKSPTTSNGLITFSFFYIICT
jgi:hypothetical protein